MLRRIIPGGAYALALLWLCSVCNPADAGSARHLFLDPAFVESQENVTLRVNPPQQREAVIHADKPWEKLMISLFLTVRDDAGKLRMWYICRDADNKPSVAYAESTDGVNWVKPELGIFERGGSTANNLVNLTSLEGTPYLDPKAKRPEERYVYITHLNDKGIFRFTSPNGLRWRHDAEPLLPFRADTQNVAFWDANIGQQVLYLRGWDTTPGWNDRLRRVVRLTLDDLSKPAGVAPNGSAATPKRPKDLPRIGTEIPTVFAADKQDPPGTDVYNLSAQPYPLDPRWYVAFPSMMLRERDISDGRLEVQFAGSTDGIRWHRYDRAPYARPGPAGSDTANMVFMGTGVVVRGDEIWQYGAGFHSRHGDVAARKRKTDGVIHRYVQRVDGFVSLDFADAAGKCVTKPVKVDGPVLRLNVDAGGLGELRVGLLDADGKPIPGFAAVDCTPLRVNSTGVGVRWKNNADVSSLKGKDVRVELRGVRAKVFSFRFDAASAEVKSAAAQGTSTKWLVLDDRVVASTENARLVPGKVVKHPAPLFAEDKPWEPRFDNVYPNVIYDAEEQVYKCWYSPFTVDPSATATPRGEARKQVPYKAKVKEREMSVCYAVSRDGLKWEKPSLGLVEFDGSVANNILIRNPHGAGVFKDARDPDPQRRYKMFYRPFEDPMTVAVRFSPDGLQWSDKTVSRDIHARADTHNNAFWSPELSKYVGITRLIDKGERTIGRTESADFVTWSKAAEVLRGDKENQTYAMTTFRHEGGVYLGLVMIFRPEPSRVHAELAWSPDTVKWNRVAPGTPLIPLSEKEGHYDWGCAFASVPVIGPDGGIRLYYGASNGSHNGWRDGFLALAKLRPDGWAGFAPVDAAKRADVTTKPFKLADGSLRVTADAAGGSVRVVALDPAEGRTLATSKPVTGDVTDQRIEWEDAETLAGLPGKNVQLRFELTGATLYAFSI